MQYAGHIQMNIYIYIYIYVHLDLQRIQVERGQLDPLPAQFESFEVGGQKRERCSPSRRSDF